MFHRHPFMRLAGCCAIATMAASLAFAQANPDPNANVVPSLKGIVFVTNSDQFLKDGISTPGINVSAVPVLGPDFAQSVSHYLGQPLTFADLNEVTHAVVRYYRDHDRPLIDAVAPAQNVDSGVIQIVITEFRVGELKTHGNKWFSDRIVTAPITLQHGDIVDSRILVNELDQANTNPFRRVNVVYQPAAEPGFTDVILQTQDRFPVQVFTGFDNSGTPVTGRNRFELGATWGNALWLDQQLSYQFSSSTDFFSGGNKAAGSASGPSFIGHALTWSMPVRGRDSISISGGFQRSVPTLGQDFGLVGVSGQAGIRYNLALPRTGSLIHTIQIGYEFKTTNNNLQFGGTQVSRTNAEINQFPIVYAANLTDKLGSTALTSSLYYSPSGLTPNNTSAAFQPANGQAGRAYASANYVYWRTDLTRLTKLPAGSVWSFRAIDQQSSTNLLYTEQLGGGGPDILRGYDPNQILGDKGIVISNELRSPSLLKGSEVPWLGQFQLLGFWDFAHVGSVHDLDGAVNHLNASSTGVGVRYNLRSNLTAKMDYGWQLQHLPIEGSRDHLLSFSVISAF